MQTISRRITHRHSLALAAALGLVAAAWVTPASAAELTLAGYRWDASTVTYWIDLKGNISDAAQVDVQTAIDEWNLALNSVLDAPTLVAGKNAKSADVVITLRSRARRGPGNFGGWVVAQVNGCSLASVAIEVVGLTPDIEGFRTRNLVRRLIGQTLGLGFLSGCTPDGCVDIMGDVNINGYWPGGDLLISPCDIAGVAAIYAAPGCGQIPDSIACD